MAGEADTCQLHLPQQWSNLRFIGPIYEFPRYVLPYHKGTDGMGEESAFGLHYSVLSGAIGMRSHNHLHECFNFDVAL